MSEASRSKQIVLTRHVDSSTLCMMLATVLIPTRCGEIAKLMKPLINITSLLKGHTSTNIRHSHSATSCVAL